MRTSRPPVGKTKPTRPEPRSPKLKLSETMLGAWRKTVLSLARFPRGTDRREMSEDEQMGMIVRQETKAVGQIWEAFTTTRGELGKHLLGAKQSVVAYLLGFHLTNAARARVALERADDRHGLSPWLKKAKGPVMWHDLGAGTGAVSHAALEFLVTAGVRGPDVALNLYDNTGLLLDAARTLFEKAALGNDVRTVKVPMEKLAPDRLAAPVGTRLVGYSLGYVWNEIDRNPVGRKRIMAALRGPLDRGERALVLVLEPAIQDIARKAMALRDQLVALGYTPLYPCPNASPCPMLARARDWCYSESQLHRPRELTLLDSRLGMDRSHLNGGFYLFASPELTMALKVEAKTKGVIVGRPETDAGTEYLICEGKTLKKVPPNRQEHLLARGLEIKTH